MSERRGASGTGFSLPDFNALDSLLYLVLLAELLVLIMVLMSSGLREFDWQSFAYLSIFVQWVALSSAAILGRTQTRIGGLPSVQGVALCMAIILGVTALTSIVSGWAVSGALVGLEPLELRPWKLLEHLLVAALIGGIVLRFFHLQYRLQEQQAAELRSRIAALQARIRPHFLFNSMNSIASLIAIDPDRAEALVEDLSDLFRASFSGVEGDSLIPFKEEESLCRKYAEIESVRLGGRLQMDWQLEDVPGDFLIPRFTLQPLLENAIYHGVQQCLEGGTVLIAAEIAGSSLKVSVRNPLPPAIASKQEGNRMAVDNIEKRLRALYGERAQLHSKIDADSYTAVLSLPLD